MPLIILGIIAFVIGLAAARSTSPINRYKSLIMIIGVVLVLIGILVSAFRQVDSGHIGVKVLFGKVEEGVLYEGLNVVNPLLDIQQMSIKTQNYTMSSAAEESQNIAGDAIRVLSKDGLEVIIDVTVLYKIMPIEAPNIYKKIGLDYESKVIRPLTRSKMRERAVYYDATELYTQRREEFENKIRDLLITDFERRGVILEKLLIRNIKLPTQVAQSIERKITAIQDAERMEFVLQKEKQEAERKRVEARGNADAQRILAQSLTEKVLQFEYMQVQKKLAESPNSKIILMSGSQSAPPIFIGK